MEALSDGNHTLIGCHVKLCTTCRITFSLGLDLLKCQTLCDPFSRSSVPISSGLARLTKVIVTGATSPHVLGTMSWPIADVADVEERWCTTIALPCAEIMEPMAGWAHNAATGVVLGFNMPLTIRLVITLWHKLAWTVALTQMPVDESPREGALRHLHLLLIAITIVIFRLFTNVG